MVLTRRKTEPRTSARLCREYSDIRSRHEGLRVDLERRRSHPHDEAEGWIGGVVEVYVARCKVRDRQLVSRCAARCDKNGSRQCFYVNASELERQRVERGARGGLKRNDGKSLGVL